MGKRKFKEGDLIIFKQKITDKIVPVVHEVSHYQNGYVVCKGEFFSWKNPKDYRKATDEEIVKRINDEIEPLTIRVKGLDYALEFRETLEGGLLDVGCQTLTKQEALAVANKIIEVFK